MEQVNYQIPAAKHEGDSLSATKDTFSCSFSSFECNWTHFTEISSAYFNLSVYLG